MIRLHDLLKAEKTGMSDNLFIAMYAKKCSAIEKELEGLPPLTFISNGSPLICTINGNMTQRDTPSPANPIYPSECGELETTGEHIGQYKIEILCAGIATSAYLGEVLSTRQIKKIVLDGTETYVKNDPSANNNYLYYIPYRSAFENNKQCMCSHLADMGSISTTKVGVLNSNNVVFLNFGSDIMNAQASGNTVAGLKEYLSSQYANGTPVTIWFIPKKAETGVINEPLRKIGNYVDTVSSISIPTVRGSNTLTVDTTIQPSKVYIKYKE